MIPWPASPRSCIFESNAAIPGDVPRGPDPDGLPHPPCRRLLTGPEIDTVTTTLHTIRKAGALMTLTTLALVLLAAGSTAGEPTGV